MESGGAVARRSSPTTCRWRRPTSARARSRTTQRSRRRASAAAKQQPGVRGPRDEGFYVDVGGVFDLLGVGDGRSRRWPGGSERALDRAAGADRERHQHRVTAGDHGIGRRRDWRLVDREPLVRHDARQRERQQQRHQGQGSRAGVAPRTAARERTGDPAQHKDTFNSIEPKQDGAALPFVLDPEPARLLNIVFGINVPPTPRNDLVTIFLTGIPTINQPQNVTPAEMLRLNVAIPPSAVPNPIGVIGGDPAGFPTDAVSETTWWTSRSE
jgi:hypothetical protein